MSDLGQAYVQIVPKATGISNKISNLLGPGSAEAGRKSGSTIASGIKKALVAAGIGAAVVGVVKGAISEGAKLQQSYGGLDTIYGKASKQAKIFAKNAATAGVSANDYAEQAVSFGAALKQAYGGDTTKAVQAANTAILDMTDNAAKMGTPINSIQLAYQGFARQQYGMLDNLKLGYGGTKSEMERLLADAEKLTGKKYDIENLGDVYDAIHAIQGELGLTGVAADEAATTFEGSLNALKANWKNLLGELALGGEEVGPMMAEFVTSAATFLFDNFVPMVGNVFKGLPEAIKTAVEVGAPKLAKVGKDLINYIRLNGPALIAKGGEFIKWLANGIQTHLPEILAAASSLVSELLTYLSNKLPEWAAKGAEMVQELARSFVEHIPDMIAALWDLLGHVAEFAGSLMQAGHEIIQGLVNGIIDGAATILGPALNSLKNLFRNSLNGIKFLFATIWNSIKSTMASIWNGIKSAASSVWEGIKTAVMTPINALKGLLSGAWTAIKSKASGAWNSIKEAITKPITKAKELVSKAIEFLKGLFPLNVGKIMNIKIPKIHVDGGKAPWGIGGKGQKPDISVTWAAQGGIVDGATLIGAGEKGAEAIVPLDPFWNKLDDSLQNSRIDYDRLAVALVTALSQITMTNELVCDGRVIAQATAPYMQTQIDNLTRRQNRKLGYV